jgi:two-component system LytT family response regulator
MKIRAIVIDDEPLAREGMKNYIKQVDSLEFVSAFSNPLQALKKLDSEKEKIDLIFLDIQMPKISGLDFLKTLTAPPVVIITTAYPDYALEGFELDVMDYLLKPVSFEKFLKSVNKAKDYIMLKRRAYDRTSVSEDFFFIKCNNKFEKISYNDIDFIEAMQNYIIINAANKKYIVYMTLKSIYDNLPKDKFIKVQKSFIISVSKIDSIDGSVIKIGEKSISISRDNKNAILKQILNKKLIKR